MSCNCGNKNDVTKSNLCNITEHVNVLYNDQKYVCNVKISEDYISDKLDEVKYNILVSVSINGTEYFYNKNGVTFESFRTVDLRKLCIHTITKALQRIYNTDNIFNMLKSISASSEVTIKYIDNGEVYYI